MVKKADDFRNVVIKIPATITVEVAEGKNGFLFDSNNGRVYALNSSASFIFRKIQGGLSLSEIAKQLTSRFNIDFNLAVSDVEDFLYQLREFNIGYDE